MYQFAKIFLFVIILFYFPINNLAQNKPTSDMLVNAINLGREKQFSEAIVVASEAARTDSIAHGIYHQFVMMDYYYLGVLHRTIREYDKATFYAKKSLAIHNRIYPKTDFKGKIEILSIISIAKIALKNYHEATRALEETSNLYRICNIKDLEYATTLNNLAFCYARLGKYNKAIALEEEVLMIRRNLLKDKSSQVYFNTLINLGSYYLKERLYDKAIIIYKEDLALKKKYFGNSTSTIQSTLTNLAICYLETGQIDNAELCCLESLNVRKKSGTEEIQNLNTINILSSIYNKRGDWLSSIKLGNKILKFKEASGDTLTIDYATILNNNANYYSYLGLNSKALEFGKKVVQMKCIQQDSLLYMKSLSNLSLFYTKIGDDDNALETLAEAEHISLGKNYEKETLSTLYLNIAGCLRDLEQDSLSSNYYELALKSSPRAITKAAIFMQKATECKANDFLKAKQLLKKAEELMVTEYGESHPNVYLYKFYRVMLLSEYGEYDSQEYMQLLSKTTNWAQTSLSKMSMKDREFFYDEWLHILLQGPFFLDKYNDNQTRINAYNSVLAYKGILLNPNKNFYTCKEVSQHLSSNECAIEFTSSHNNSKYGALIINPYSEVPEYVKIPEISKLFDNEKTFTEASKDIWKKLSPYISNCSTIYFSLEGKLTQYPIESVIGDSIKAVRLSCTSEIIGKREKNLTSDIKNFSLIGGIKYSIDQNDSKTRKTRGLLGDITATTLHEVSTISNLIKAKHLDCNVYTGFVNKRILYDNNVCNKDIIHIATHGYFYNLEEKVKNSFISNYIRKAYNKPISFEEMALLRCGLLFSPNSSLSNQSDGNNYDILTGNEIAKLHLNSDLVVLSACETGNGIPFSDGVYGLQRAFKKAGAQSILMTLWKVDDEATMLFMTEFYKDYLINKSKHHALKTAQSYLKSYLSDDDEHIYSDPYYWAGFILLDALN